MMASLTELAHKHCTDKREILHNYMPMYTRFMESYRNTAKRILEIGMGLGGSGRMWVEAFPYSEIWIIDIKPQVEVIGAKVVVGSQQDQATWDKITATDFDFIIDDGSHVPGHQISSMLMGFAKLKPGGVWFIEDTHCDFHENFNPSGADIIYKWVWELMMAQQADISTGDFYKVRAGLTGIAKDVYAYHFYKSVIALEKAKG